MIFEPDIDRVEVKINMLTRSTGTVHAAAKAEVNI